MIKNKGTTEIQDGREDAIISVNGEKFITIHQEGYAKMGITYAQAREFVTSLAELFVVVAASEKE